MTTSGHDNLHRVKQIFDQAIDFENDAERDAFLDEACTGLDEIRREVEALLAEHESAGGFLEQPADLAGVLQHQSDAEITEEDALAWLPDDRMIDDRYHVERVLAIGGMGVVYEATQESPQRRVALKVMRRGLVSRTLRRRFQYEAETLGRLKHPHIAQVYDAGVHSFESIRDDGEALPYFVMEFVEDAQSITEYAKSHDLSTRDRIRLFCDACEAIQHGHQRGIIHRDIKPANILVDDEGCVKVIDFGVARITDADVAVTTMRTGVGEIVGTVQYMSPEQCDGDPHEIDVRSDVYSLGLVLFELLTDELPYSVAGMSIIRAVKTVRDAQPSRLSAINKRLRGDIEVIVETATAKNVNQRYPNASDLREDLQHYLSGEPISARKPTRWLQLTRWMGRHPIASTALASILCAVVILATTFGLIQHLRTRPNDVFISPTGRSAQLLSMAGNTLAKFGTETSDQSLAKAVLAKRPRQFGGGKVLLYSVKVGENSTRRQLWVCEPDKLGSPVWQTYVDSQLVEPPLPKEWQTEDVASEYIVQDFLVADVFEEIPGTEIVVVHMHCHSSPSVIRVYDFSGEVLFESWHFGHVRYIKWWQEEGLIVAQGDRHGFPDVSRYGYYSDSVYWPSAVFALRPHPGKRTGWVNEAAWLNEWRDDDGVESTLAWYKTLWPQEYSSSNGHERIPCIGFLPDTLDSLGVSAIVVKYRNRVDERDFEIVLGADGSQLALRMSDAFESFLEKHPDLKLPHLVDWPPPMPDRDG